MNCGPVGNTVNIHGQSSDQAVMDVRSTSGPSFYLFETTFAEEQQLKPWSWWYSNFMMLQTFIWASYQQNERKQ